MKHKSVDHSKLTGPGHLLQVGFTREGKILAMDVNLYNNAGCSLDLSAAVMDRALMHCENSYRIPNVRAVGHVCRTNIASNTAFRGFGGPQVLTMYLSALQHRMPQEVGAIVG